MTQAGYCECGCGERTKLAPRTHTYKGWVKGEPMRFVYGHQTRRRGPDYLEEDRGYTSRCWIWQGCVHHQTGYASMRDDGRTRVAHVVYYEREIGPVPADLELDHLCGQRSCVRVSHLEPVTHLENVIRSRSTKLTAEQVAEIRRAPNVPGIDHVLAERYGLRSSSINGIRHGRSWRGVV